MSVSLVRKFDFGASFDPEDMAAAAAAQVSAITAAEAPPPPTYSQDELDAAVARAVERGIAEGEANVASRLEQRFAEAVESMAAQFSGLMARIHPALDEIEREAAAVILSAAERLFPSLVAEHGRREIEALLVTAFSRAIEEPKVTIRCSASIEAPLDPVIRDIAAQAGFSGRLIIVADPAMADTDCRVEWTDGGVERSAAALLKSIESILRHSAGSMED